jgi:hypothetical protein
VAWIDDTFVRANQTGWGTATAGDDANKAWDGGTTNWSISANTGITPIDFGVFRQAVGDARSGDVTVFGDWTTVAVGDSNHHVGLMARVGATGSAPRYEMLYRREAATNQIRVAKYSTGGGDLVANAQLVGDFSNLRMRLQVTDQGANVLLRVRWWQGTEPSTWNLEYLDTGLLQGAPITSGNYGVIDANQGAGFNALSRFTADTVVPASPVFFPHRLPMV